MPESEMTMVERIARIIDPEGFERWEEAYQRGDGFDQMNRIGRLTAAREKAKAAMKEMREPSEEMKKAGEHAEISDSYGEYYVSADNAADIFRDMVDAALKEHGGSERMNPRLTDDDRAKWPYGQPLTDGIQSGVARNDDIRFRGKRLDELTREEAIEALHQAVSCLKALAF